MSQQVDYCNWCSDPHHPSPENHPNGQARHIIINKEKTSMDLNEYQNKAMAIAVYPGRDTISGLSYTVLGLCGEAGELANKLKKILRDDEGVLTEETRSKLVKELGGVLWYVAAVASELEKSLSSVGELNLKELYSRKERGTLQGSGDDR